MDLGISEVENLEELGKFEVEYLGWIFYISIDFVTGKLMTESIRDTLPMSTVLDVEESCENLRLLLKLRLTLPSSYWVIYLNLIFGSTIFED